MKSGDTRKTLLLTGILLPVIAGVIVELFTSVEVLKGIARAGKALWTFISHPVELPLWSIVLLPLLGILVAGVFIYVWQSTTARTQPSARHNLYTQDRILEVDWKWEWMLGKVGNLVPLCPKCSYQPDLSIDYRGGAYLDGSMIRCDNCGFAHSWSENRHEL